jgi:hypothetical protein
MIVLSEPAEGVGVPLTAVRYKQSASTGSTTTNLGTDPDPC